MPKKISDLEFLPDGQDLTNVLVGVDNTGNATSYKVTLQSIVGSAQDLQEILNHQAVLGVPSGATDLGAFTGDVLTDAQSVKVNLQELSDALESLASNPNVNLVFVPEPTQGTVQNDAGTDATTP